MKTVLLNYTFSVAGKTITLTDVATVRLDRLALITDVTTNKILYNFADLTVATATVATNVITLSALQGGEANSDKLRIDYDAQTTDTAFGNTTEAVQVTSSVIPTGASTAAKQPALGTAGSASADVLSVQGVASMTALKVDGSAVTQPVSLATNTPTLQSGSTTAVTQATGTNLHTVVDSGTVTANVGTTNGLALDATLTGGTQKTKLVDTGGTNVGTIKAASTAAIATDTALVVAVSPNNTVPVSLATNTPTLQSGSTTAVTQATASNLKATVTTDQTTHGTTDLVAADITKIGGNAVTTTLPVSGTVTDNQGTAAALSAGWPVINGELVDTSGTFTNGTQTTSVTASNLDGYANVLISVNGTYGTATAVFEGSDDSGTTWYPISEADRTDSNVIESGYTTLTNISRAWQISIPGFDAIRVRSTAVASGTVNVRISPSAAPTSAGTTVSIGNSLPAGTAVIGHVIVDSGGGGGTQYSELTTTSPATATAVVGRYQTTPPTLTNGQMFMPQLDASGNLNVNVKAGSGSGLSVVDSTGFTPTSSSFVPGGGAFNDNAANLAPGQQGTQKLTTARAEHMNLRDSQGKEVGITANPITVDQQIGGDTQAFTAPGVALHSIAGEMGDPISTTNNALNVALPNVTPATPLSVQPTTPIENIATGPMGGTIGQAVTVNAKGAGHVIASVSITTGGTVIIEGLLAAGGNWIGMTYFAIDSTGSAGTTQANNAFNMQASSVYVIPTMGYDQIRVRQVTVGTATNTCILSLRATKIEIISPVNLALSADALAIAAIGKNVPAHGAIGYAYNGTTFDRVRTGPTTGSLLISPPTATGATVPANAFYIAGTQESTGFLTGVGTRTISSDGYGVSNANSLSVSALGFVYNGTTIDRNRSAASDSQAVTGIPAAGGMTFNGSTWDRMSGGNRFGDGGSATGAVLDTQLIYNGTTFDRQRSVGGAANTTGTGLLGVGSMGLSKSTSPAAYTTGNYAPATMDVMGEQIVTSGGLVTTAVAAATVGNTVIKASAGRLCRVMVTTVGANTLQIFDNSTTNTGTIIGALPASAAIGSIYDFEMPAANGITVAGSATNPAITISWI